MNPKYDNLTNETFLLFCARYYNNPQCQNTEEFYEDLRRIKYIKKLFTRFEITGELKYRLILNHIIILNNVFGPVACTKILLFKISKYKHYLKPFLIFLNILPSIIYNVNNQNINTDDIPLNDNIIQALRTI